MKKNINYFSIFIILIISIIAGALLYGGFGSSNNNEQIPLVYRMVESSYLSNDWFVNLNDDFVNTRFYFTFSIFLLSKIISNLEVLYFSLFLISYFFIGLATYKLSKNLFNDEKVALLTSFLVIFGSNFTLGGNQVVAEILIPSLLSLSFALWGFYFLIEKRYFLFSFMLGFSIFFHFLLGGLIFIILFFAYVLNNSLSKTNFRRYIKILSVIFLFLILIFPIIAPQINTNIPLSGEELVKIIGEFRHPHHYMPFSWSWAIYTKFLFFFFLFMFALENSKVEKTIKSLTKKIVYIILAFFLIGTIFVEIIPLSIIVKMQFFRSSIFLSFMGYLFIVPYIYKKFKLGVKEKLTLRILYSFFLMVSLFISPLILIAFPIFVVGEYLYLKKRPFFKKLNSRKFIFSAIFISLLFFPLFLIKIMDLFNYRIEGVVIKFFVLAVFSVFSLMVLSEKERLRFFGIILLIFLLITIIMIRSPILTYDYGKDTQEIYSFIRDFTPSEAILLTPPYIETFRLGAERAIIVDFKSFPFSEKAMVEWAKRIKDVSNSMDWNSKEGIDSYLEKGYNSLSKEDVFTLKEKYNISYAVFERPSELNFTVVFKNEGYIIYLVE